MRKRLRKKLWKRAQQKRIAIHYCVLAGVIAQASHQVKLMRTYGPVAMANAILCGVKSVTSYSGQIDKVRAEIFPG